ncbi:magnesium transporter [Pseudoxanthomonas sp. X-1]|uniref:magnesium transporter n=1 Tax=Pseudoxanthomonas sp. X-1 TaxID=2571115 RepID=UPI00110A9F1C|nr:magnesium transporter [Pseudoxanthomonas sp. X-1]TMN18971.1 magnesium transporter [Pseudoxanthomonas sp. X-1]UAY74494.1 magnesium transporter [Pseudoxanthomonas sp. X-1]
MNLKHFSFKTTDPVAAQLDALRPLNTADVVERLNKLKPALADATFAGLSDERAINVLEAPELLRAPQLLQALPRPRRARVLEGMADDRAADVVQALELTDQAAVLADLAACAPASAHAVQKLMRYRPRTAGALMTTEYVGVPADWTVAQTLDHVREVERKRETVYAIYVLAPGSDVLQQVVTLRRLITGAPADNILTVAQVNPPVTVSPLTDQQEVARLIRRHDLLSLAVVDEQRRMLGIVTVDDIIDTMMEESTEDAHKFGGMEALDAPYMQIGFWRMIRKRAGWLCALFLGEMLTASAMQHFEGELDKALVLTLFIPLIMSSGGNSGSQATSLLIRALALGELRLRDWWKVAVRELPTGMLLGAILGVIAIVRVVAWQKLGIYDYGPHWPLVALTVGAALVGIVTFGSLAGSMLPFVLQRLRFDPASASAPFVATLVDVTGLVIYFSIALLILRGTLL